MKKITAIFIIFAVLAGTFMSVTFASVEANIDSEKAALLSAIGVFDSENIPNGDETVSRGVFLNYLLKLVGKEGVGGKTTVFWDVTEKNEFFGAVSDAKSLGFINGNPDGSFAPYSSIDTCEAVVIMINALGYGPLVKLKGNYPASVHSVANELKIANVLNENREKLNFSGMVTLFYDSINCYVCDTSSMSDKTVSFEKSDKQMLDFYRNIKKYEGEAEYTDITLSTEKGRTVKIDGTRIFNVPEKFDSYIGYDVELWADETVKPEFVYMLKTESNKSITIDFDNIVHVNPQYIEYDDNSRTKTARLNLSTRFYYNGVPVDFSKHSFDDIFAKEYGEVELVSKNGGSGCNAVHITIYDTVALKGFDEENEILYDLNSPLCNADLSKYELYEKYNSDGKLLNKFSVMSVLTVTKSLDNEYAKIVMSDKTAEGKIDEIDSDGYIYVNGGKHKLTPELKKHIKTSEYKPGTNGKFLLDTNGRVAYIDIGQSNKYTSAFIVGVNSEGSAADKIKLKLFTANNEYINLNLADSVKIDGKMCKKKKEITDALGCTNTDFVPTAAAYGTNDGGEITYIDTPTKNIAYEDDTTLVRRYIGTNENMLFYKGSSNINYRHAFGGKFITGNDDFFVLINEQRDWDDLSTVTGLTDDKSYKVDIWSFSPDSPFGSIVLVEGAKEKEVNKNVYLFAGIKKVTDSSEKYAYLNRIDCYRGGAQTTLYVPSDSDNIFDSVVSDNSKTNLTAEEAKKCENLKSGDLFRVGLDSQGYVVKIEKLYDYNNKLFLNPVANAANKNQNSAFESNSSNRLLVGDVYLTENGYARFSTTDLDLTDPYLEEKLESIYAVGYMYSVDNNGNITMSKADASSAILGKKYGEDIKIFVQAEYTRPQNIYYIKNN